MALIYGTTGTLNMADIGRALYWLDGTDRLLFAPPPPFWSWPSRLKGGGMAAMLLVAADLCRGLAPAAAMMAIATKVGIYVILRLSLLVLGP